MKIKICGLSRDADIEYVNEALPDYIGFVFAESRRRVSPASAAKLRRRLSENIVPVGVFVNAPVKEIAALYRDGIISIAQLHGTENADYIIRLKEASAAKGKNPVLVIKTIQPADISSDTGVVKNADYYLVDSGAGSGRTFNWNIFRENPQFSASPFFLAGGITLDNIIEAMSYNPYALDISSGAETDGIKDRQKILALTSQVRKAGTV